MPLNPRRLATRVVCLLACIGLAAQAQTTRNVPTTQYPTIQSGIAAAANGDTVLVAKGNYSENIDFLGKAITVSGANGCSGDPSVTTIDGHLIAGAAAVSFQSGETRSSIVCGFTITGGGHSPGGSSKPGGIYVFNSAPTITNNIITTNTCYGINVTNGAALIQGNNINGTLNGSTGSCTYSGAGVLLSGTPSIGGFTHSSLIGNTIENNVKAAYGGGVMINAAEGSLIHSNIIRNNSSLNAGGLLSFNTVGMSILQNLVYGNSSTSSGVGTSGGISILAPYSTVGPFIGILAGNTITGNTISYPVAGETGEQLTISGNLAQYVLVNNIIVGSSAIVPPFTCSASANILSITPVSIDHNDIYNSNSSGQAYGGACSNQTGTFGNISANPNFVNASTGNYQLQAGSPALDAGNNSAPLLTTTDLANNPRIADATSLGYPVIDLGAYERTGPQNAPITLLTLAPSTYTPTASNSFPFTITLTSPTGQPTGAVSVYQDAGFIGSVNINSAVPATLLAKISPGLHAYTAVYPGSNPFQAAVSVKFFLLVANTTIATTTTALTVSPNPATSGQTVTLTASVTGSTSTPTGQVKFCDATSAYCTDGHLLGTAQVTSAGTATLKLIPAIGTHTYKALFVGTSSFASSTSPNATLTVTGNYPTTTTLAASGVPGNYTLTAVTTGSPVGPPTGTISFLDQTNGNSLLGSAPLGNGSSTLNFVNSGNYLTTATPESVVTADFNGDGIPDLAVAARNGNTLTILLGKGDGTFTALPIAFAANTYPMYLAAGDFNSDGKTDLALVIGNVGVEIFLGKGDGTFTTGQTVNTVVTNGGGGFLVAGDFNNDGILDLAEEVLDPISTGGASSHLQVLIGKGDGTFTTLPTRATINHTYALATADLNGDGKLDIVSTSFSDYSISILLGNGDGTFNTSTISNGVGNLGFTIADLNNDGIPDIVTGGQGTPSGVAAPITVLLGKGDGTFTTVPANPATTTYTYIALAADFNLDGNIDVVTQDFTTGVMQVLNGKGDGTFTLGVTNSLKYGLLPFSSLATDFNGDGVPDIALALFDNFNPTPNDDAVKILLTQSTGKSTAIVNGISPTGTGTHLAIASYPGSTVYAPSLSNTVPLTTQNNSQTITFTPPTTPAYAGTSVPLSASSTSALPVTFTVISGPATVNGSILTYTGAGTVIIQADQPGNASFTAAAPVQQTVAVTILTSPVATSTTTILTTLTFTTAGTLSNISVLTQGAPNLDFTGASLGTSTTKPHSAPEAPPTP